MNKNKNNNPTHTVNDLFFVLDDGKILAWNYKTHEQYHLEEDYFSELLYISQTNQPKNEKVFSELLGANLITQSPPKANIWGWDILSRIFHTGTQNVGSNTLNIAPEDFSKDYVDECSSIDNEMPALFLKKEGELIELPEPDISLFDNISYFTALKNRKTCREFNSEQIKINELSLLLYCSFGLIHGDWDDLKNHNLKQTGIRKSSPSSGGIHSEEIYLISYRVEGLEPGLYHYGPQNHHLTTLKIGNFEKQIIEMNYNQFYSDGLAFGIYITSRLDKIWWKYKHSRSYRTMLLDIGHVSQSFLTSATALGMQTWMTGAFHDTQVEDFLNIDNSTETSILFVGAGKGTNQSIPNIIIDQLKNKA